MDLQLVEAYIPDQFFEKVNDTLKDYPHVSYFTSQASENRKLIRVLVKTRNTEEILNYLERMTDVLEGSEVLLFPVQTYITKTTEEEEVQKRQEEKEDSNKLERASRQELLGAIKRSSHISLTYTLLVVLSAIVVTIGFIQNSEAVIIGAMVIAPMLGPTIAIAFASILGDFQLLRRSTWTLVYAIMIVLGVSTLFTVFFPIPIESTQFIERTHVNLTDIILALASGTAGALSILNRLPGSLVGVMVAVALLPPTVVFGMTLGAGMWKESFGAFLLLMGNINSVILAAIIVFSLSGIRPVIWSEVAKAETSRKLSILFISIITFFLVVAILFSQNKDWILIHTHE